MRRSAAFIAAVFVAGSLFAAAPAGAEPSGKCGGAPAATGTDGATSVSVCAAGGGAVTAAAKGGGGYIVADGDSGNPDVSSGYVGVDTQNGPVCNGAGDYSYGSGNACTP